METDYTKWPYAGHMRPGDHDDYPDGCNGNCDGICEGWGRREVVELLQGSEGGHRMAVEKIIRLEDELARYKAMVAGCRARDEQERIDKEFKKKFGVERR